MGIRYPGSNMQELNLDWVLSTVKENTEKVDTQLHDLTELEEKVDSAVYSVDHMTVEAETLQPEDDATATKSIINGHINIEFGIPKGEKGDPGQDGQDGAPATDAQVQTAVNAWLADNIDPDSGYALDRTLTLSTAAAPADLVGTFRDTIAPKFSASVDYPKNQYVYYNDILYRFTADHQAGAWTGTDAAISSVGNKLRQLMAEDVDLRNAMNGELIPEPTFTAGKLINSSNGNQSNSSVNRSASGFIPIGEGWKYLVLTRICQVAPYTGTTGMAFYTTNDVSGFISGIKEPSAYISSMAVTVNRVEIPSGAKYFRTTWIDSGHVLYPTSHFFCIGEKVEAYGLEEDLYALTTEFENSCNTGNVSGTGNPLVLKDTSGERFNSLSFTGSSSGERVVVCGKNIFKQRSGEATLTNNNVTFTFDEDAGTIRVHAATPASAATASASASFPAAYRTLNGINMPHNFHFKFKVDTLVAVSDNCSIYQPYNYPCKLQVVDGTNTWNISQAGTVLIAEAGKEYGVRVLTNSGWTGDITFKPQVEIGSSATVYEAFSGIESAVTTVQNIIANGSIPNITCLYTDGNANITADAKRIRTKEAENYSVGVCDNVIRVTGGRIMPSYTPKIARDPMVCFIDDDTTNIADVERFHDIFSANNVVGNYAVMTSQLDSEAGLSDLLLDYEEEGFGCLYHCYYQSGNATNYFQYNANRDMVRVRENFVRGLRSMREYGFFAGTKHWVTPYGVNDADIRNLAKEFGIESLIKMSSGITSKEILTQRGPLDRYDIPRFTFSASSALSSYQKLIDACAESGGVLLVVSHVNTWPEDDTTLDTKMNTHVQYAITKGVKVANYCEFWEDWKSLFYMNEIFS